MAVLEIDRISKRFGHQQAVEEISLRVEEGNVYGFLGPNGAGKTTSIRMMLGLIAPDSGSVRILGRDVRREFKQAIRPVGAMIEGPAFYGFLSARKNLQIFAGITGRVSRSRVEEVLEEIGLTRRAHQRVDSFSKGMRQRLGIGLALLERPRLLVLDEPTDGLDPQGVIEIRNLVRRVRDEEGTTVFLSSHLLGEIEQICDRVAIAYRGRILQEGRLNELIPASESVARITLQRDGDVRARALLLEKLKIEATIVRRGCVEFDHEGCDLAEVNRLLVEAGLGVSELSTRACSLEEYFVSLTGESAEVY